MFNEIILLTITVFLFNIMHTYKKSAALYNKWNRKNWWQYHEHITQYKRKKQIWLQSVTKQAVVI